MKIITITSGKGGVGKTNIAVNLAISLAGQGYRTCLFDADIGLANVNILMGIVSRYNLEDVMNGSKILKEVIIKDWNNIDIIPGSSGVEQFETITKTQLSNLMAQFSNLDQYDYIIVDTGAGISKSVISFCLASSLLILTIVPEPTSLTDAYSLLKVLSFNGYDNRVNVIVNRCKTSKFGEKVFEKFKITVQKYINLPLNYLGMIHEDEKVADAVSAQSPFTLEYPDSKAAKAIIEITDKLRNIEHESPYKDKKLDSFIKKCSNFFQTRLKLVKQNPKPQPREQKKEITTKSRDHIKEVCKQDDSKSDTDKKLIELLERLVVNTDKIFTELKQIKEKINTDGITANNSIETDSEQEEDITSPPVLTLDFEKFVQKKTLNEE